MERSAGAGQAFTILEPNEGAAVAARPLLIRWTLVAGAVDYDVRIHDTSGSIVWQTHTSATSADATNSRVKAGQSYYASVVARLQDGKTVASSFAAFNIVRP